MRGEGKRKHETAHFSRLADFSRFLIRDVDFIYYPQAVRVEQLELELAQAERIRIRKQERETSRMMRKLEHVAAAYLQYVWRRYCHLKREAIIRKARAERLLVDFLSYRSLSRKSLRRQASCRLQRHYRAYLMDKKQRLGLAVLASFILPIIRTRRARRHEHAIKRQAWSHWQICRKREHSVQKIQRAWRVSVAKANIRCCVQAFDRLKKFRRLARSARVIQRTLGTSIIQRRLLGRTDFAEYLRISVTPWPRLRPVEERVHHFWVHQVKLLQDGTTAQKRLVKEEKLLQSDIVDLQRRIGEAKTKLKSETERFRRHVMLEEHRRQKEEDARHVRLHELEEAMLQAIRLELEHEFETARRLMLRNKRVQLHDEFATKSVLI